MKPTAQRRKRLLLVLGVAAGFVAAGGGVYLYRQHLIDATALASLERGRRAFEAGDYEQAVDGIGTYILRSDGRRKISSGDYLLYAKARRLVPMPNGEQMVGAIAHLRKALEADPTSRAVQDELLEDYLAVGFATEALGLLDKMLEATPHDLKLLRTKCDVLEITRQFPKALEVARVLHELDPDDFGGPVRTLQLMVRAGTSNEDIDVWLAAVTSAHPGDPRFDLLRAAAFTRRQERDKANAVLDRVLEARNLSKDSKFLGLLMGELDAVERFDDAMGIADRVEASADLGLKRECLRRLWYADRFADLATRAEAWSPNVGNADAEILGFRVMALTALRRTADAAPLRTELSGRSDEVAKAWSSFLAHWTHEGPEDLRAVAAALESAVKTLPERAVFWLALGDARAGLGETDAAVKAWQTASNWAQPWARPLCRIADAMRATGRPALAVEAARAARIRGPRQVEVIATWMRTLSGVASKLDPQQADALADASAQLRGEVPEVAGDLLPAEASLLVRSDVVRANELLRSAAAAPEKIGEAPLLRLAEIAADAGIPLVPQLLDACERVHGVTPRLALARALAARRTAGADAGLAVIDSLRARPDRKDDPAWDTVRASYLDAAGDPGAGPAWIALADARPEDLSRQLGALSCDAVWSDLAAVDRIIARVKSGTGDVGLTWRTARARRLLADPAGTQDSLAEARGILDEALRDAPENTSLHSLLAQALERLGDDARATEQLRIAAQLAPDDVSIAFEIARIARKNGQPDVARQQIDRALGAPRMTPAETERAAAFLATLGDFARSAELLGTLLDGGRLSRRGMIVLAESRAKLGDVDGALDVCARMPDPPERRILELSAELYAMAGRADASQAALARLDAMDVPAADRELLRARIATHRNAPAEARDAFRRALAAAPGRADVWSEFVTYAVAIGDAAMLSDILADPAAAASEGVRFLAENKATCVAAVADARLRGLVLAAMESAADRTVLLEAARTVTERWSDSARRRDAARRVQALADSNLRVRDVQLLAVDLLASTGDVRAATDVAARASRQFPESAEAARRSAELLARSGRWPEAAEAGRVWLRRSGRSDPTAELFVARALLQCDRAGDAADVLAPSVPGWMARPADFRDPILTYLVTLARSRRLETATRMLDQLAADDPSWRTAPLDVRAEWLGDPAGAVDWLDACGQAVPADDRGARLRLGRAWAAAAEKFGSTELLARARQVIEEITSAAEPPAEAFYFGAVLAERAGDLMGAARGYQSAVDRDPLQANARNNLAMIQADAGQVDAAVANARRLVADHPRVPEFIDTLAYALRKGRKFAEAKSQMLAAIEVDPQNPAWRIGLAEVLSEGGEAGEAAQVLARVEEMAAAGTPLPPELQTRIDRVRSRRR